MKTTKRKINNDIVQGKTVIVVFKTSGCTYGSFEATIHIKKYPGVYVFLQTSIKGQVSKQTINQELREIAFRRIVSKLQYL
jgi:hypothetical protein